MPAETGASRRCATTTETGSVFAVGTGFDANGDALEGTSQVGLPTLGALGITNIGNLRIILNATEPAGNSITVSSLALSFYDATGGPDTFFVGNVTAVPEPAIYALMLGGLGAVGFVARRRMR